MRERSKKLLKTILFPIGFILSGCVGDNLRPVRINTTPSYIYPEDENIDPSLAIKRQIANTPNTQNSTSPITIDAPSIIKNSPRSEKVSMLPIKTSTQQSAVIKPQLQQQPYTPYYQYLASTKPGNKAEDVILEETVYIPSALSNTPIDEIEIISDAPVAIQQNTTQNQEQTKTKPTISSPTKTNTENVILEEENITSPSKTSSPSSKTTQESKPVIPPQTPQPQKPKKVQVKKGDTLYSIANTNNVKVYDLAEHNKISAPFTLKLGQIIEIPLAPVEPVATNSTQPTPATQQSIPTNTTIDTTPKITETKTPEIISNISDKKTFIEEPKKDFVIVKKGDTIYSIARANNVPLKDVILRNNLQAPYTLSIGSKIYIPNSAFHIVRAGDTVYSISRKYNVNLNSLVKLNKINAPYTLSIGQKILLPATNVDVEKKQIEYVVKDKSSTKLVNTSQSPTQPSTKQITQVRVAKKEKLPQPQTQVQVQPQTQVSTKTTPSTNVASSSTSTTQKKPQPLSIKPEENIVNAQKTKEKKEQINRIIAKPEPLSSKKFRWPTKGKVISEYGIKNGGKRNDGINISAVQGSAVLSAENGIVAYAGNELKGLGNLIIIKHDKDYMTIYAHNDNILVKKGDTVRRGTQIATVGKTGRVSTPQLHFEVRKKTKSINPRDILE